MKVNRILQYGTDHMEKMLLRKKILKLLTNEAPKNSTLRISRFLNFSHCFLLKKHKVTGNSLAATLW